MANDLGIYSVSQLDGIMRRFGVGMNNQNAAPQFARAAQVVPAAQKKNIKRLRPHGWCHRSHGGLHSAVNAEKRATDERRVEWALIAANPENV